MCGNKEIQQNRCPRPAFFPVMPEDAPSQVGRLFAERAVSKIEVTKWGRPLGNSSVLNPQRARRIQR
jgi:hypothetical protein